MHFLRENGCLPLVVVDLESNRSSIVSYLKKEHIAADFIGIADVDRDNCRLSPTAETVLTEALKKHRLNKAIISTEPKGHLAYGRFFLNHNMDVLIDKPITAPVGSSCRVESAQQIYTDYGELRDLAAKNSGVRCVVQSQRRYHAGYRQVKRLLQETMTKYDVPLTHIYSYHCDGLWNMPNEYRERENHPYKYGYGKLMHSGYHFVDVFAWLAELNWQIERKRPDTVELFHQMCEPNDCLFQVDADNYRSFFGAKETEKLFAHYKPSDYQTYGEVDSYTQLQLKRGDQVVTSGAIHLLQNGFSRRAWSQLPEDTYKGNGRVRHEQLNVQVGPLLNVQINSCESHEIHDDQSEAAVTSLGGLEHFEIAVFRNKQLIGGNAVERWRVRTKNEENGYLGHNEEARQLGLQDFLRNDYSTNEPVSEISQHDLTNRLLSYIHLASCQKRAGKIPYLTAGLTGEGIALTPAEYSGRYEASDLQRIDP